LKDSLPEKGIDLIISNPPYVSLQEWEELSPSIKDYEPRLALLAGEHGLEVIEKLIREAPLLLKPGGILLFEIGWNQADKVRDLFGPQWDLVNFRSDYQGIPRVCRAVLKLEN
jgi:release factor glutamine methyltransferase